MAFGASDTVIMTLERLRGAAPIDPPYKLGAEWGPGGTFSSEAARFSQLVRPTLAANRQARPDVVATVLEGGYGTQCTRMPDGNLSPACKIH